MRTNIRVKTSQAADVAGVGYEGFRTWLKRGLLKTTGTLPRFYAPTAPAEINDSKRWRWAAFGFSDLCSFRLTKLMLDTGLPWETVCTVASDEAIWRTHQENDGDIRYLAVFPGSNQYTPYTPTELAADIASETVKRDWMILFDLHELRRSVVFRHRGVALRTMADQVASSSHIYTRSGPNVLSPAEAADRQTAIVEMAGKLQTLAVEAEAGSDSCRAQFETILGRLHALGKFPDGDAVSAVACALVD